MQFAGAVLQGAHPRPAYCILYLVRHGDAREPSFGVSTDGLGIASLAVALAGFPLAIWQIRKSVKASEAARTAVEATSSRHVSNQLLILVPELLLIDRDLGEAIENNERSDVLRLLVQWRHRASQVRGILIGVDRITPNVISQLANSAALATMAKQSLQNSSTSIVKATKRASAAISSACNEISAISGELSVDPGEPNNAE